jgi:hypothetical protein
LLLLKLQRKMFGSEILFLSWLLFIVRPVIWISIVTIVELYCKQRSLGHTRGPNMYYDITISSTKLFVEVM